MVQFKKWYLIPVLGVINLIVQIVRCYAIMIRYPASGNLVSFPIAFGVFVMSYALPFLASYYIVIRDYVRGGVTAMISGILWGMPVLMNPTRYLTYLSLEYLGITVNWVILGLVGVIALYYSSKPIHLQRSYNSVLAGALLILTMIVSIDQILLWDAPRLIIIV